ncbi:MAG TPA: DedA family protein [Rhizomicrobium sp.]|jgi:membrane protein DedA with SNARE-associated domain
MHDLAHACIEFIRLHSVWAGPVMFIVSFGESFVGLSFLFPGTTIMVIAGTLVHWQLNPHGPLDPWPILIGGILGAVIGDAISFWFGRKFGHHVEKHWFFVRHPDLLARGYAFFERFGTASVFIGRFFGPVRAAIPLVAGVMVMSWRQFWIANVSSAIVWAPALLLIGTGFRAATRAVGLAHGEGLAESVGAVVVIMILIWLARQYGAVALIGDLWRKYRDGAARH